MPYIHTRVNVPVDAAHEENIKARMGKAIAIIPGKSEAGMMFSLEDNCKLYYKGDKKDPVAVVEVKLMGQFSREIYTALTAEICKILLDECGIPGSQVYVIYLSTDDWGCDGYQF